MYTEEYFTRHLQYHFMYHFYILKYAMKPKIRFLAKNIVLKYSIETRTVRIFHKIQEFEKVRKLLFFFFFFLL